MASTDVEVAAAALVRLGAKSISSFSDGSTEATVANDLYEKTVAGLLSSFPWRFAVNLKELNRDASTPAAKWDYAFQLPTDLLVLRGLTRSERDIPYDRYGAKVFCNQDDDVIAEYVFRASTATWPGYFVQAAVLSCAEAFAIPVTQHAGVLAEAQMAAAINIADARRIDSQSQTTRRLVGTRLAGSRR